MQSKNTLTIWMDFSIAYLMENAKNKLLIITIGSGNYPLKGKHKSLLTNNMLNLSDQEQLSSYYQKISNYILDYDEVTLFGPVGSKNELFGILLLNPLFNKINMSVKDTAKMNDFDIESFLLTNSGRTKRNPSAFRQRNYSLFQLESVGNRISVISS